MFKVTLANWTRWIVFALSVHYTPLFAPAPKETNVRCVNVFHAGVACYAVRIHCLLLLARTFRRQGEGERRRRCVNPSVSRLITETRVAWKFVQVCGRCFIETLEISFSRFEYRYLCGPSLIGQRCWINEPPRKAFILFRGKVASVCSVYSPKIVAY